MVLVYTQGCPRCKALEQQLDKSNVAYEKRGTKDDLKYLMDLGFTSLPVLELEDGTMLTFKDALKWAREAE